MRSTSALVNDVKKICSCSLKFILFYFKKHQHSLAFSIRDFQSSFFFFFLNYLWCVIFKTAIFAIDTNHESGNSFVIIKRFIPKLLRFKIKLNFIQCKLEKKAL